MAQSGLNSKGSDRPGSERRAFQRHPIHLPAELIDHAGTAFSCLIRDYCLGGVLVVLNDDADRALTGAQGPDDPGGSITVRCHITANDQPRELVFRSRIAHVNGTRAGLAFVDPDLSALHALQEYAKSTAARQGAQPAAPGGADGSQQAAVDGETRVRLVHECNEVVQEIAQPLITRFHEQAVNDLFETAREMRDVALQNAYFAALEVLNKNGDRLYTAFLEAVDRRLQNAEAGRLATEEQGSVSLSLESLSLVEEQEFDTWLSVTDFVDTMETRFREQLESLQRRLEVVFGQPMDGHTNPYGPALFAQSFQEALDPLELKHAVVLTCYKSLKRIFGGLAGNLYEELNHLLVSNGILPELKYTFKAPTPAPTPGPDRVADDEAAHQAEEAPRSATPPGSGSSGRGAKDAAAAPSPVQARPGSGAARNEGPAAPGPAPSAPQDLYQLVGELRQLQTELARGQDQHPPPVGDGPVPSPRAGGEPAGGYTAPAPYTRDELLGALSSPKLAGSLPAKAAEQGEAGDLRARIEAVLAEQSPEGVAKTIGQREGQVIDVANNVFTSLLNDLQVAKSIRPWVKRLEVPVLKMALLDDQLFVDSEHIVRQVINKLAALEILADTDDAEEQAAVTQAFEWLVHLINDEFDGTTAVFERAAHQLDLLLQAQHHTYQTNIKQVVAECLREHGQTKAAEPEAQLPRPDDAPDEWARRVGRLEEGHWVLFDPFGDEPKRLKIAWIAARSGKYIFVNVLGKKDRVLLADELAELLRDGTAVILDDAGEPAMDRAQYNMLQKLHQQLLFQSTHDALTGLINRNEFERCLDDAVADAKSAETKHALCFIDVDQFKVVNASCGYEAGDELLKELTGIFQDSLAAGCTLARLGTDQFGMLLRDHGMDDALAVVEEQMDALHDYRFTWNDERMSVSISVGLVGINAGSDNARALLQAAESSCGLAKEMGGNRVQVYHAGHAGVSRRKEGMKWAAKIDKALDENALHLRCQKIVPINGAAELQPHYELLLGLSDDLGGQVELQAFVKAAENHRRMIDVDRWVIRHAFEWIGRHERELLGIGAFSINLSGPSLNDEDLFHFIREQVKATGVPIDRICFEITETAGITNLSDAADFINTIKSIGCQFSLDDFGSGMSSYAYLKNLPVDYLKIDGAFIKDVATNANDFAVAKSVCEIGHFMDKLVVAEYVQDEQALEVLREIGVDFAQGYGVEQPQPLDALLVE